uniref:Uncharacterized protein n=1 Tax=Sinocyclocheilus grahami TaxID=75366 RepID=A0A672NX13_SINGR
YGQKINLQRMQTLIWEMMHLVGCSRAVVMSMHQKWCTDGQVMNHLEQRLSRIVHSDWRATNVPRLTKPSVQTRGIKNRTENRPLLLNYDVFYVKILLTL